MIRSLSKITLKNVMVLFLLIALVVAIKLIRNYITSPKLKLVWKGHHAPSLNPGALNDIICLSFAPNNKLLASSALDGTVKIWDVNKGIILKVIQTSASSLAFSPDGKILALSIEGKIKLYQTNNWQLMKILRIKNVESASPIAFSPTGELIATGGGHWEEIQSNKWVIVNGGAKIFDIHKGKLLDILYPAEIVDTIAFSPIDRILAIASRDINNKIFVHIWDVENWREITNLKIIDSYYALNDLAFSPNGLYLAAGGDDGIIRVWRTDNWTLTATLRGGSDIQTVTFSPDGKWLASKERGALILWQVGQWNRVARWRLKYKWWLAEIMPSKIIAYSPNGQFLATGDEFGTIYVFEGNLK